MGWQSMNTAPFNETVEVEAGDMVFPAILLPDHSLRWSPSGEEACDQWVATTDRHPECWSGGGCWESNEDENRSAYPERWRHLAQEPRP